MVVSFCWEGVNDFYDRHRHGHVFYSVFLISTHANIVGTHVYRTNIADLSIL